MAETPEKSVDELLEEFNEAVDTTGGTYWRHSLKALLNGLVAEVKSHTHSRRQNPDG